MGLRQILLSGVGLLQGLDALNVNHPCCGGGPINPSCSVSGLEVLRSQRPTGGTVMAKGEQRGNREAKKPKQDKPKTIAAAAPQKGTVASIPQSKK